MMNDNELMHYGVLGMKGGVHRGRVAQSYGKAVAKRNKLDKRVEVAKAKAQKATVKANTGVSAKYKKLQATADKYQRKADKKKYGFIPNQKKAAKLQVKADRAQFKADRAQFKANKYKDKSERRDMKAGKAQTDYIRAQRKAQKWVKQMDKTFKGKNISQISKKHKDSGKNYVKRRVA